MPLTGFPLSKEPSMGMDEDLSSLSSWTRSTEKKKGWKPWPTRDGPSADVTGNPCVRPPEENSAVAHPAVSVFAVRFAHTLRHGIRFRCLTPTASFHLLLLSFSFSFCSFFLRRFFLLLFFPRPFLLGFPPPALFRLPDHGYPARPSSCLWSASVSCVSLPVLR